jgi:LmbE family N-acetylglucosaminyl deacetylase
MGVSMGIRKILGVVTGIALITSFFSCGGSGGGSSAIATDGEVPYSDYTAWLTSSYVKPEELDVSSVMEEEETVTLSQEESIVKSPAVETVQIAGEENALVTPTKSAIEDEKYVFTFSDVGLVIPVEVPELEIGSENYPMDSTIPVYEIVNPIISSKDTPIPSTNGKISMHIDSGNVVPEEATKNSFVLVNWYGLLDLPTNSYKILKEGCVPLPQFSGYLKQQLENDTQLMSKGLEEIYLHALSEGEIPYFKVYIKLIDDTGVLENENATYRIFVIDPDNQDVFPGKEVSVVKVEDDDNVTEIPIMENELKPFILARCGVDNIREINGTISLPYSEISLKKSAGFVVVDKNNNPIGFGEFIDDSGNFKAYYIAGSDNETTEEDVNVYYAAFSTAEESVPEGFEKDILKKEVCQATKRLGIREENLFIFNYEVRKLSYVRQAILEELIEIRKNLSPDLILMPSLKDIHQDHVTVAQEGLRAFKTSTILGYELIWNNLTFNTTSFVILQKHHIRSKANALKEYRSQEGRDYMSEDFIFALAKARGVQIGVEYAESFEVIRWVLN